MKTYNFQHALNHMIDCGEEWTFESSFGKYRVLNDILEYYSSNGWESSANTYNTLNEYITWFPVPTKPKLFWRRQVKWPNGNIDTDQNWYPSKLAFMSGWHSGHTFGPWESMEAPDFVKDSADNYDD